MPQEQGTSPVNSDYITNLTAQINATNVCADLQALTNEAMAAIKAQFDGITIQLDLLGPLNDLLTGPSANLGAIVSWITNFISTVLVPLYKPYVTYIHQAQQLISEMAALVSAIEAAAARIGSCSITINQPSITLPSLPS